MIVFIFDWFRASHCDKCDRADRQGEARWWQLVGHTWSPEERETLRKAADMMADEEE